MSLALGVRLGAYEILSLFGSGGMGDVYRARDTRLDRTVAIKVLPPQLASDPQFRERFDREMLTGKKAFDGKSPASLIRAIPNYDISADGQRFVMVKDESGSGRLNVVLNWFDELTRLVPTGK